jgi:hypothetical protein
MLTSIAYYGILPYPMLIVHLLDISLSLVSRVFWEALHSLIIVHSCIQMQFQPCANIMGELV